jgi:hypothetical protein
MQNLWNETNTLDGEEEGTKIEAEFAEREWE